MHIVYAISLGGGPEAFIKNMLPLFEKKGVDVSIVIEGSFDGNSHKFPVGIPVYKADDNIKVGYYLFKLFSILRLNLMIPAFLIRKKKESNLLKILTEIEKTKPIDIIEVTEGTFIGKISKTWNVVTRAHGSDWSFRFFCNDQDTSSDSYLIKWQRDQHLQSRANFAISRHTIDHLSVFCEISKNLIAYQPYPIPLDKFEIAKPIVIADIPENAPIILSIGRLEKRKGMDVLVQSMNIVWDKFPEARLILLGKEAEFNTDNLLALVDGPYKNKIIHPGFVHYSEIPSYYKKATVYVSASQYETFGYTILEAMAAGCPVISTNRGALPELTGNNEYGLSIPYGNPIELGESIIALLSNEALREQIVAAALVKAKSYDLANIGEEIINSYSELKSTVLDLGCGTNKVSGSIGMDNVKLAEVDIVHDLLDFPYPFKDRTFDDIYMRHVAEHFSLENIQKIFNECRRLLKSYGKMHIHVPHAFSVAAYTDITHKSFFVFRSGDFWDANNPKNYYKETESLWQLHSTQSFIVWYDWKRYRLKRLDNWMSGRLTRKVNKALRNKENPSLADRIIKRHALQFVEIQWIFQKTD